MNMEVKNFVDKFPDMCRACTSIPASYSIFNFSDKIQSSTNNISEMMIAISKTDISLYDGLPNKICESCLSLLEVAFQFQEMCIDSYNKMKSMFNFALNENIDDDGVDMDVKFNFEVENAFDCPIKSEPDINNEQNGNNQLIQENIDENAGLEFLNVTFNESSDSKEENMAADPINIELNKNIKKPEKYRETLKRKVKHEKCELNKIKCEKKLNTRDDIKQNVNVHDPNGEQFQCDKCKNYFSDEYYAERHCTTYYQSLIKNDDDKVLHFKCEYCDRTFEKKLSLASHMRVHSGSGETFCCSICNEVFSKLHLFKKHRH